MTKNGTGTNVIGYINNNAPTTVVLGAHYDHWVMEKMAIRCSAAAEKSIHNGADDNASGTAALIELASLLKASKNKNNNYFLLHFPVKNWV